MIAPTAFCFCEALLNNNSVEQVLIAVIVLSHVCTVQRRYCALQMTAF